MTPRNGAKMAAYSHQTTRRRSPKTDSDTFHDYHFVIIPQPASPCSGSW